MTIPASRIVDAHQLEADGIVYLYKITLASGSIIRLKANDSLTYNGNLWEGTAIQIDQRGRNSDGQKVRPKLVVANPAAAYSSLIAQHLLDNALVQEFQVLRADVLGDHPTWISQSWRIRKILTLTRSMLTVELRDLGDGQRYILPARSFTPPQFPTVSL